MNSLFNAWKSKVPNYDVNLKESLFDLLTKTGGGSEESRKSRGKHFANNYELYTYAFFLGLYKKEFAEIKSGQRKNFSVPIQDWGKKDTRLGREDFTKLQQFMFMAVVAKTEVDLIALEKGELEESEAVKKLINTMESITNGGLILIKEKLEDNPNYFLQNTAFLDFIEV